uniref:Uncharacterized protein n=1 Tax=Vespula pensylvanica TaxID=30213 RepID=A0A834K896_VESPE|nr:hypothetical protein H0235_015268 [Vespula pensylvanica]
MPAFQNGNSCGLRPGFQRRPRKPSTTLRGQSISTLFCNLQQLGRPLKRPLFVKVLVKSVDKPPCSSLTLPRNEESKERERIVVKGGKKVGKELAGPLLTWLGSLDAVLKAPPLLHSRQPLGATHEIVERGYYGHFGEIKEITTLSLRYFDLEGEDNSKGRNCDNGSPLSFRERTFDFGNRFRLATSSSSNSTSSSSSSSSNGSST